MHKYLLFSIIKESHLYSWKNYCGTPENREKGESLAQQIFPRLRYVIPYGNICDIDFECDNLMIICKFYPTLYAMHDKMAPARKLFL